MASLKKYLDDTLLYNNDLAKANAIGKELQTYSNEMRDIGTKSNVYWEQKAIKCDFLIKTNTEKDKIYQTTKAKHTRAEKRKPKLQETGQSDHGSNSNTLLLLLASTTP